MKKLKPLKITPVKDRPMLHWVGKKPLNVEAFLLFTNKYFGKHISCSHVD